MKIQIICQQCGKEFYRWPSSLIHRPSKYCSNKCRGQAARGALNPAWHRVKRTCSFCGKEYFTKRYLSAVTKYCSMLCLNRANANSLALKTGPQCANWKGGTIKQGDGYYKKHCPNHPHADGNGYVLLHRLILEEKLGRYLLQGEVAHHVDFDKTNNGPDNLMPMKVGEHTRHHRNHRETRL